MYIYKRVHTLRKYKISYGYGDIGSEEGFSHKQCNSLTDIILYEGHMGTCQFD